MSLTCYKLALLQYTKFLIKIFTSQIHIIMYCIHDKNVTSGNERTKKCQCDLAFAYDIAHRCPIKLIYLFG